MNSRRVDLAARIGVAAAVWVVFAVSSANYRTVGNFYSILEGATLVGFVAMGVGLTVLAGELDLSVGSMAAVAGVIAVRFASLGFVETLVVVAAIGLAVGVLQGFLICRLQVSSVVLTLASLIGLSGVAFILSKENTVVLPISKLGLATQVSHRFWIFAPDSLAMLLVLVAIGFWLRYSRGGREVLATGGGRPEAIKAGIRVNRTIAIVFGASGMLAAVGGALSAVKAGSAEPNAYGDVLLSAVTAILIGGIAVSGGRGGASNILIGVLVLSMLDSGISIHGYQSYISDLVTGILLLVVLIVEFLLGHTGKSLRAGYRLRRLWPRHVPAA